MLDAVKRGIAFFDNKRKWNALVKRAMNCDFSWSKSAETYKEMYCELLGEQTK